MRFETNVEEIKQLPKPVKIRNGSREAIRVAKHGSVTAVLLRGRSWAIITGEPYWRQSTGMVSHQSRNILDMLWCLVDLGLLSRLAVEQHEQEAIIAKENGERKSDISWARKLAGNHGYKVVKKPKRKKASTK